MSQGGEASVPACEVCAEDCEQKEKREESVG